MPNIPSSSANGISSAEGPIAYSNCSLFLQKSPCSSATLPFRQVERPRLTGNAGARTQVDASPGASVAELVDAGDSHSPGTLQVLPCMPCGFDSRLGHHQSADARRGRVGQPCPPSVRGMNHASNEGCGQQQTRQRSSPCLPRGPFCALRRVGSDFKLRVFHD